MTDVFPARYSILDGLPPRLFRPVATHVHGELLPRARAVLALRRALIAGRLPDRLSWPHGVLGATVLRSLRDSRVAKLCEADPEAADEVLHYLLTEVADAHRLYERGLLAFIELGRRETLGFCEDEGEGVGRRGRVLDEATRRDLRARAEKLAVQAASEQIRHRLHGRYGPRGDAVAQLQALLEALAACVGAPPGSMNGVLRTIRLEDVEKLREILAELDECHELLRTLGRETQSDDPDVPMALISVVRSVQRQVERIGEVGGRHMVRGVERTGEIERMLASEAVLLAVPFLRGLWHARRAERSLLGYHAVGVLSSRMQTSVDDEVAEDEHEHAERGPIIIVLDTSGSMEGAPETVAKALVLQLMTVAFLEERRCYLFDFSGPTDLGRHELTFDADGLARALAFLTHSFHGGTVPSPALRAAYELADQPEWQESDVVLVSDGYFAIDQGNRAALQRRRRSADARLHGARLAPTWSDFHSDVQSRIPADILPDGFQQLECDELHDLTEWLRAARRRRDGFD